MKKNFFFPLLTLLSAEFQSFYLDLLAYEMRLMEHHENPQLVKRENSNHSSPIPTPSPSPPSNNLRVNSIVHLTTTYGVTRKGKVVAYDNGSNLVTLRT